MNWSTDKIIAIGLLVVLIALVVCGGDKDVTSFLAGGLVGYLQRSSMGHLGDGQEVRKIVEAVGEAKDAAKKQL